VNTSYPRFLSQKLKSAVIRQVQSLYEKGKLIQGRQRDASGGACVLGAIVTVELELNTQAVKRGINVPPMNNWEDRIVEVNDLGYTISQVTDDGGQPLVPPSSYNELIQILKDSPVEGEEK